ncbi:hypothetical protein ACFWPH_06815 [Nocardia sp. NPDC058499]|uniref:hypothetical protein n=1 Tax=Nocardia sp. NPDC058499 TaxID=3346530 RepID=UPI003648E00E
MNVVRAKAGAGVQVRILLGESDAPEAVARGREEGLPSLAKRCESTLEYLRETMDLPMVDIRMHRTTLYNSIYRFGDSLLVNTHSYGAYASKSPVQHLQNVPGGRLFAYYMNSFEAVWKTGRTVT